MPMPDSVETHALAIIGTGDVTMGFKALGFKVYPAAKPEECRLSLDQAIADGAVVCLIQEDLFPAIREKAAQIQNQPIPVLIPFALDSQMKQLDQIVKTIKLKATGVDKI